MKENVLKAVFSAALAGLSAYFQVLVIPLVVLAGVMLLDYCTGMAKAWMRNELSSRTGIKGILKKIGYLVLVAVAMVVDWLLRSGLAQIGVNLNFEFFVALVAVIWLIVNELISILENLEAMGVDKIPFLSSLIRHLKKDVEDKAGDLPGKEE